MLSGKISCLIIDDEQMARELVEKYIKRLPYLELLGSYENPVEGMFRVQTLRPDLIFLDIEMSELNGFELLKSLPHPRPQVIMITADPSYAVQGFDLEVADYLLKPVAFERFTRAVNKVTNDKISKNSLTSFGGFPRTTQERSVESEQINNESIIDKNFLILRVDKKLIKIEFEEITFIEAMKDYLKVYWTSGVSLVHMTMSKIEEMLPDSYFLRVNRSYIVRKALIKEIDGSEMTIVHGRKIPIGSTYRDAVLAAFHMN